MRAVRCAAWVAAAAAAAAAAHAAHAAHAAVASPSAAGTGDGAVRAHVAAMLEAAAKDPAAWKLDDSYYKEVFYADYAANDAAPAESHGAGKAAARGKAARPRRVAAASHAPDGNDSASSPLAALGKITQRDGQFTDEFGRVRIFRGVNDVRKSEPYYSDLDEDALAMVATEWGYNIIRMGFSWEGYERERGVRDPAYLDATADMVARIAGHGMYTLIDNHQDLMSRSHCGNGFPTWVVRIDPETAANAPFPTPLMDGAVYEPDPATGWIRGEDCARSYWAYYYFTAVTGSMFESLYADVDGIQTALVEMWRSVAAAFAGRPEVIGYEIVNEPFPGSIYRDPRLLFNATFADETLLVPMYDRIHQAIRSVDNDTFFFFEPLVSNTLVLPRTGSGLTTPGGPDYADRGVLSFHGYCINPTYCDEFFDATVRQREADSLRMGVGKMLTEFGHLHGTTEETVGNNTRTLDRADASLLSWTTWEYATLAANAEIAKSLVRPYARAVAGELLRNVHDVTTRVFVVEYRINPAIAAPTEVFVPVKLHYPEGYTVAVAPADAVTWSRPEPHLVWIEPTGAAAPGLVVTVTVAPVLASSS